MMANTAATKLAQVQRNLHVPKGRYNQQFRGNYRNAEDIIEAAKPHLPPGLAITITDAPIEVCGAVWIRSEAVATDGETGDSVAAVGAAQVPVEARGINEAQRSCLTASYARKYALGALLMVDDGNDDDTPDQQPPSRAAAPTAPRKPAQPQKPRTIASTPLVEEVDTVGRQLYGDKWPATQAAMATYIATNCPGAKPVESIGDWPKDVAEQWLAAKQPEYDAATRTKSEDGA